KEFQKSGYVQRLRTNHGDFSEMTAVHGEVVFVRLDGVVRHALFDPEILKEPPDPFFVVHRAATRFTSRSSASSRDRHRCAAPEYVAGAAAIAAAKAVPFCMVCPA